MAESIGRCISSISKYIKYYINQEMSRFHLNMFQAHVLRILYDKEGISQDELVDILKSDKITVSKLLDHLVQERYVEKGRNDKDKRIKNLYVTQKGESIKREIQNVLKKTTNILSQDFSEKENIIVRKLLERMLENIYDEVKFNTRNKVN